MTEIARFRQVFFCLALSLLVAATVFAATPEPDSAPADERAAADPDASSADPADPAESTDGPENENASSRSNQGSAAGGKGVTATYDKGLRVESADGNYKVRFRWRLQTRITDVESDDLLGEDDGVEEENGFVIRRARFKMDGHAYRPWLGYYLEYGIAASTLLTWQLDLDKVEQARLRVGQYKIHYNRERVDSSGKQQFVDRSIVNRPFTVDRQSGLQLHGHLFDGTPGDSRYALGVFTGTGRGGSNDDDREPMYMARWQWNFLGRDLPFAQSDTKRREKPAASIGAAGATNKSRFTRFSSSGGGQLDGFEAGEAGQYELRQWMAEFALHFRGLSLQSEYHEKRIDDRVNDQISELSGYYAQAGFFFHELFAAFPSPLELAVRYAQVDSDRGVEQPKDREATLGANWFFANHENKLTLDASHLETTLPGGSEDDGWRVRFQWDITF